MDSLFEKISFQDCREELDMKLFFVVIVLAEHFKGSNIFIISIAKCISVADPGFPRRGGANPQGGGANLLFCPIFTENCMKMKEFGPGGGGRASLAPPLRSANAFASVMHLLPVE